MLSDLLDLFEVLSVAGGVNLWAFMVALLHPQVIDRFRLSYKRILQICLCNLRRYFLSINWKAKNEYMKVSGHHYLWLIEKSLVARIVPTPQVTM